jgi:hypothetical protein
MQRKVHLTVWIFFGFMFSPTIFPCTFELFPGAKKARRQFTAVFVGKVLNVRSLTKSYAITFSVTRSWKGIKESEVSLEGDQGLICSSIKFENGKTYLVYAYGGDGGLLTASEAPGYSKRIEDATKDIKDLGPPKVVFNR